MTVGWLILNIRRLMTANVPEQLDAWRMVTARRRFDGSFPLSVMPRLQDSLVDVEGVCQYSIEFGQDALQMPYAELIIEAALPLQCQRSLQRFLLPVHKVQRLGLVRNEADEAALPEGYEALLIPADGMLHPLELVEDELILALPVVAYAPDSDAVEYDWPVPEQEKQAVNPFAVLAGLKKR